ncbi:MAG: hypothetical protein ACE1S7_06765 [Candidatus Tisiphia sp.]
MEILGASFAYYRIFSYIYAELENLFCGNPESLAKIEQLFYDGERLSGDITEAINNEQIQQIDLPPILIDGRLIEYLPNSAFSFHPNICSQIKKMNIELGYIVTRF